MYYLISVYNDWQLKVNVTKSHVLHLHKNNPLTDYYFDGYLIESCDLFNDIGVDIDLALHFDKHLDRIVAKAYSRIAVLFTGLFLVTCMCLGKHNILLI